MQANDKYVILSGYLLTTPQA